MGIVILPAHCLPCICKSSAPFFTTASLQEPMTGILVAAWQSATFQPTLEHQLLTLSAQAAASSTEDSRLLPESTGQPAFSANSRAVCLRLNMRMVAAQGPRKAMPACSQASTKAAFSLRKP